MKNVLIRCFMIFTILFVNYTVASNLKICHPKKVYYNSPQTDAKTYSFYNQYFQDKKLRKHEDVYLAQQWITKAKKENNYLQLVNAYKVIMYCNENSDLSAYADSIVNCAHLSKNKLVIGNAYLSKGIVDYQYKRVNKALDNYIIADKYIAEVGTVYEINKLKYVMAQAKYYLGYYSEALALLNDCQKYFEMENDQGYLTTMHFLALCYNKLEKYGDADKTIEKGLIECDLLDLPQMISNFKQIQAINNYDLKRYNLAMQQFNSLALNLSKEKNTERKIYIASYQAKIKWHFKKYEEAVLYLLKADKLLNDTLYIKPDFRSNYELLIKYYNVTNNVPLELKYIKKLQIADKILNRNYKYLSNKIHKEYDEVQLIRAHNNAIQYLHRKENYLYALITVSFITIIFLTIRHILTAKANEKKFLILMEDEPKKLTTVNSVEVSELNPKLIEMILKNLERFEDEKKYLGDNMNLTKIAKYLNTNTKYTSKIISKYRGKKTVDYINDLKIEYIIKLLKSEKKYRNYTNAALSDEAGFGSSQNFTRAFKSKTTFTPTYFINKLSQVENK